MKEEGLAHQQVSPSTGGLSSRLTRYKAWRDELQAITREYQKWLDENEAGEADDTELLDRLAESLDSDKMVLALVGEFSRGKTELLNALLFADLDGRVLPSAAGRTTMCPTELRYDERESAHVRLLPIETRKSAMTIAEYRKSQAHWHKLHILKPNSPDELRQAFQEFTRTKRVHVREAQELGLYYPGSEDAGQAQAINDMVEVPVWRHAIVNYPHPLLRQGLVVLDTPGLNALGAEPELTLSMLPAADAVLFLLAADTGVTQTDLEVWRNHVCQSVATKNHQHIVVLNKIDILWDELAQDGAIRSAIAQQVAGTARHLGVTQAQIYPVSAKQALTARAKGDDALLERSGLRALEKKLADEVVPAKYEIVRRRVVYELNRRLDRSLASLQSKAADRERQIADLKSVGGENRNGLAAMVARLREEKQRYEQEVASFQETRRLLAQKAEALFARLGMANVEDVIAQTRLEMKGSWTTAGLRQGIASFFKATAGIMDDTKRMADDIQSSLNDLCRRLHEDFGRHLVRPPALSLLTQVLEMKKLETRAEAYRNSAAVIVAEQNAVIERFFLTLVAEARRVFESANEAALAWFRDAGARVYGEIQSHKASIDTELEMLRVVNLDMDNLSEQIEAQEGAYRDLKILLAGVNALRQRVERAGS